MLDDTSIGARLQAGRRAMGLTQTEVGTLMDMVTSTISAIEAGKRSVSGTELYQFAQILNRPLEFFLSEKVPAVAGGFQYLFRQATELTLDRASIAELEQLAADYRLLEELVDATPLPLPPNYASFGFSGADDAETLAEMERSRLGLGDAPIKDLAVLLDERVGARTFMLPVAHQSWSGLVVRDVDNRPCIAVNSKEEPYRRNYDLAHEYGHVLVHIGRDEQPMARVDISLEEGRPGSRDERFVDMFAASFLMPRRAVLDQLDRTMRANRGRFTNHDLVHLAMHFGVSGQAMSLRLVTLRKMPRAAHDNYWKERAPSFKAVAEMLGYEIDGVQASSEKPVLPKRYRFLALTAHALEIISLSKLAELLREDVFELRKKLEVAGEQIGPR